MRRFVGADLTHIDTWVFDLDNTLYPASCDLFAEIDQRMTTFVAGFLNTEPAEARAVQKKYYAEHGTTLNGLMLHHGLAPEEFLDYVHDIDLSVLPTGPELRNAITGLPGRKLVYTNGSRRHAERVTEKLGLSDLFDGLFGIEDSGYRPKPQKTAYDVFLRAFKIAPARAAFFEDLARNLAPAKALGFTTVLVHSDHDWSNEPESARPASSGDDAPPHVDYVTDDLPAFLRSVKTKTKRVPAMSHADLAATIDSAWDDRTSLSPSTTGDVRNAVEKAIMMIDAGEARVAEPSENGWIVNQWLKKAVLLGFRLNANEVIEGPAGTGNFWDKVPSKFAGWGAAEFEAAGFRAVPGAIARRGSYIAPNVVLMPSFVNIGAYVDEGTMVDTWATVGSCAQIGKNCHISGGTGIGGVLEPLQANPVIIEDNCFIGARAEVAEGVIVREGSVIAMGVFLSQSTKIVDRQTGEITYGEVPPYSVVVPGTMESSNGGPNLAAAIIIKTVDERTRSKTGVNELLRD